MLAHAVIGTSLGKHAMAVGGLTIVFYCYFQLLFTYDGWLGWDDANRIYSTLSSMRTVRSMPIPWPLALLETMCHSVPEPPLINTFFATLSFTLPSLSLLTVLYLCTFGVFVLQACLVFLGTARLTSAWTGYFAVLCLLGSQINTSIGLLFIAETSLSVLFLLAVFACVAEAKAPSWHRELFLGACLGLAMLDKSSTPLLFFVPCVMTLLEVTRRHGYAAAIQCACLGSLMALSISMPWYVPNLARLFDHLEMAVNTSGNFTGEEPPATMQRLLVHVFLVAGLPNCLSVCYLVPRVRREADGSLRQGEDFDFLARIGLYTAGFLVLFSLPVHHFEPRYFHVATPVLAIVAAAAARQLLHSPRILVRASACAVLFLGLGFSTLLITSAPVFFTDWNAVPLLDRLKANHPVTSIAFVGNTGDWNLGKLRMLNELTADPGSRSIAAMTDPYANLNWRSHLESVDYVLVLHDFSCQYNDEYRLHFFNQEYQNILEALHSAESPFERVEVPLFYVPDRLWLYQRKTNGAANQARDVFEDD